MLVSVYGLCCTDHGHYYSTVELNSKGGYGYSSLGLVVTTVSKDAQLVKLDLLLLFHRVESLRSYSSELILTIKVFG